MHIFDADFNRRGIVSHYISVEWSEDYYNRGNFMLVCVDSTENIALLKQGWYVYRADKETAMVIRYVKYEQADRQIIIRGYTTNDLINQRIIYKTQSVYNVEAGMYNLVKDNIRAMPRFITATPKGLIGTFDTQFTGTNLLEAETALGTEAGIGFYTKFDHRNKQHIFTVYQGVNRVSGQRESRPAIFSAELKNLANVTIIDDISLFRNVAYVAGGGEGEERTWIIVNDGYAGLDRFELFVDARDLQRDDDPESENYQTEAEYIQLLTARGIQKLNECIRVESFVAEVEPKGFGTDYYLGDIVSCKSDKYGVRINTRILSYSEVRENNITKLSLTMGNPEITALEVVKTWL